MIRKIFSLIVILGVVMITLPAYSANESVLGKKRWMVQNDGDFVPGVDSTYDIGESGLEVANIHVDSIWIGGTEVTGASQVSSPMEDVGTYTRPIDAGDNIKLYDNGNVTITGTIDSDGLTMENDATVTNAVNNTVVLTENSDTVSIAFDGNDVSFTVNDGSIELISETSVADGTIDLMAGGDTDDYVEIILTGSNTPSVNFNGCDGMITASGGDISFNDENLVTTGTLSAGATSVTSLAGCDTITGNTGGDTLDIGANVDDSLTWASADEASVIQAYGFEGKDAILKLTADEGDDNGDDWQIEADATTNGLIMSNDSSGAMVAKLTVGTSGNVTLGGTNLTFSNDDVLSNPTDDIIRVASNDADTVFEVYTPYTTDGDCEFRLHGDAGADAGDRWSMLNDTANGVFILRNDSSVAGTYVTKLTVAGTDGDITTTGDVEIVDDMDLIFGTGSDWKVQYDEGVDDQLLFVTANTGCTATTDPMVEFIVGGTPTADQQVFGVSKGTQASNTALLTVDEDGDVVITGDLTITGNGLNSAGDLLITPTGTEVHIDGGLSVGDTTAIGDNNLNVVGTTTLNGAVSVVGTTPKVTIGDGGDEDATLVFDGQTTKDFYVATDNADDSLIFGVGSTVGTDSRITIQDNATATLIEIGDGAAEDCMVVFDGQSDMYIGIDDAGTYPDDLVIGAGAVMATTPGIVIANSTADVTVVPDFTVLGGDVTISTATASKPAITIQSDVVGATSSITTYKHTRGGVDAVDGDDLHTDIYQSYDDGTPTTNDYVTVLYDITDSAVGAEDGSVAWSVSSAGTSSEFLALDGVGGVEINSGAVDIDVHIDGNDAADLLVVDAGNNDVILTRALAAGATTDSAIFTVTQSSATADNGCVNIVNAAGSTATDATVVIQSSAAGVVKSSLLINHDGTAGATTEAAVVIDTEDVKTAALYLRSPVDATGTTSQIDDYVLSVVAEGIGGGASLYRNVTGATEALLNVREIHADSTAPLVNINTAADATADDSVVTIQASSAAHDTSLLAIVNAGVGRGLFVDQNVTTGTTLVPAMEIDSQVTNGAALIVRAPTTLTGTDGDFDDYVMGVSAEGVGGALHIHRDVDNPTGSLVKIEEDNVMTTSSAYLLEVVSDVDASASVASVQFTTTSAANDMPVLSVTQAGTAAAITIVSGDLAVNGDTISCDGDLTITPAGADVLIDSGLTVGSTTQAGDNNLRVEGTSALVGDVTLTGDININGDNLNCDGDLTITPATDDVLIDAGVNIGGTTQAGDNNLIVEGTTQSLLLANVTKTTTTEVLTSADYGKNIFFTYAGAVTVTLPANGATAGSWFRCINANSNTTAPTYAAATADTLITFNNAQADSVTFATGHRIGSSVFFISNGSFWTCWNESANNTMTITDA